MDCLTASFSSCRHTWSMEQFSHTIRVLFVGCMIQSALLFPLANEQSPAIKYTTLSIFIITTLGFTAANGELLFRIGIYTVPTALLFLLSAVLQQPAPPKREFLPWLPSVVASVNMITFAIGKILERTNARPRTHDLEDGPPGLPIETLSNRSTDPARSSTNSLPSRQPSLSGHLNRVVFGRYGPSSRYSRQNSDSDMSLSEGSGRFRPGWSSDIRGFFPNTANFRTPTPQGASNPPGLVDFGGPGVNWDLGTQSATSEDPLI